MIPFRSRWIEPILAGRKTVTLRKWTRARVKVGEAYDLVTLGYPSRFAKVKVTGLRKVRLRDVDDEVARRDGAASAKEVKESWKKKGLGMDGVLWLVEFRLLEKKR